jgi:hypothetical protein
MAGERDWLLGAYLPCLLREAASRRKKWAGEVPQLMEPRPIRSKSSISEPSRSSSLSNPPSSPSSPTANSQTSAMRQSCRTPCPAGKDPWQYLAPFRITLESDEWLGLPWASDWGACDCGLAKQTRKLGGGSAAGRQIAIAESVPTVWFGTRPA